MDKPNSKMAKLAKEADSNVVGDSFISQPDKDLTQKLGVLFGVVEIYNTNDAFTESFLEALGDLKTEYYLPPFNLERGIEKRFEEALARTNRRLQAAVSQSIEEIDLRNISAAVGLFYNNKIYVSAIGRIKGFFCRRKKNLELFMADILGENEEKKFKPEPEKIFANIINGELSERDAVLFVNEEFLAFFSQHDLAEIALNNPAAETIKFLETGLAEKVAKKNFYAVVIKPATQVMEIPAVIGTGATKTESAKSRTIAAPAIDAAKATDRPLLSKYDRVESSGQKISNANLAPGKPQQSIDKLLFTQVRTEKYLTPSLLPGWQKILLVIAGWLKKSGLTIGRQIKKLSLGAIGAIGGLWKNKIAVKIPSIKTEAATTEEPEQTELEPTETTEDYLEPPAGPTEKIAPAKSKNLTEAVNNYLNAQFVKFLSFKKTQQIILIAGLILIFLFAQSVVMIGRSYDKNNNLSGNDKIVKQIEEKLSNAEALNIFSDENGALNSIRQARELLSQIPDKRANKTLRAELAEKINQAAYTLQKITYLDKPTTTADFLASTTTANLVGLAKTGKVFWVFNGSDRSLWRFDLATGKLEVRTTTLPAIKKLTALDDKNLILLSSDGSYYKYDIAKKTAAKTKPAKDWFKIKNPTAASPLLDPSLASSTIAMSALIENYNFFLDPTNTRLIIFDKNGALKRQFVSPQFSSADSFAASVKEKRAWIFSGNKIYQVDLNF